MNSRCPLSAIKLINSEYKPILQVRKNVMAELNLMVSAESVKFSSDKSYGGSQKFLSSAMTSGEAAKLGIKKFLKFTLSRQTRQSILFFIITKKFHNFVSKIKRLYENETE